MGRKANDTDADISALEETVNGGTVAVLNDDLSQLSFANLMDSVQSDATITVRTSDEFDPDDGFLFVEDKNQLVGSQFVIVKARYFESEEYGLGVQVKVVTNKDNRVKFVDFGTGIRDQLKDAVTEDGEWPDRQVILVPNGLVASTYGPKKNKETGEVIRPGGTTFYLDTSGGRLPAGTL